MYIVVSTGISEDVASRTVMATICAWVGPAAIADPHSTFLKDRTSVASADGAMYSRTLTSPNWTTALVTCSGNEDMLSSTMSLKSSPFPRTERVYASTLASASRCITNKKSVNRSVSQAQQSSHPGIIPSQYPYMIFVTCSMGMHR